MAAAFIRILVCFQIFVFAKAQCIFNLNATQGRISDPHGQGNWEVCTWIIDVNATGQILLTIEDLKGETCETCSCDYIQVKDGFSSNARIIGTYCPGNEIPVHVLGSTNQLTFTYMRAGLPISEHMPMNPLEMERGFNVSYKLIEACGGVFTEENGTIASPSADGVYPNNANCSYFIQQPEGYRIFLKVEMFLLQEMESGRCPDKVEISHLQFDVDIGTYCGELDPFSVVSSANLLYISFRSDNARVAAGFKMSWERIKDCGGEFTDSSGQFSSLSHENTYPLNADCTYRFSQPQGKKIILSFSQFNLASSGSSCTDFIEFKDSNSSEPLSTYCGEQDSFSIMSTQNKIVIRFKSDMMMNTGTGFMGSYVAIDYDTEYGGLQGSFSTPRFFNSYPVNSNLSFSFMNNSGESYIVTFPVFRFAERSGSNPCVDYLQIGNETICGEQQSFQRIVTPESNAIYFVSDLEESEYGADIMYDACNVSISQTVGVLRSPGFPVLYPQNIRCVYEISNSNKSVIIFNFTYFDLPTSANDTCEGYVMIEDGMNSTYRSNETDRRICGRGAPFSRSSDHNIIRLTFVSGSGNQSNGFQLNFFEEEENLEGNISPSTLHIISTDIVETTAKTESESTTLRVHSTTPTTNVTGTPDSLEGFWNVRIILLFVCSMMVVLIVAGVLVVYYWKRSRHIQDSVILRDLGDDKDEVPRPIPSSNLSYL